MKKIAVFFAMLFMSLAAQAQFTVIRGVNPSNAFTNLNADQFGNVAVNCVIGCGASSGTAGVIANGAATTGVNPLLVGGSDGTNLRTLNTDASGHQNINVINTPSVTLSGTLPAFASTPAVTLSGTLPGFASTPAVTVSGTPTVSVTSISAGANNIGKTSPQPTATTATDCSGTITTGGTSQTALASNTGRHSFYVQNTSAANLALNFTSAASLTSGSIILAPGAMFYQDSGTYVASDALTVIGATTGQTFVCKWF